MIIGAVWFLFRVILRLREPQLVVFAALINNKRIMTALLDDLSVVEYGDVIAETAT